MHGEIHLLTHLTLLPSMSNYYCYQSFHSFKSPQILNFIFIEPQTDKDSLQYSLTLPLLSFVLQSESNSNY